MRVDIVTIFPEYFGLASGVGGPLGVSLIGKAAARGDVASTSMTCGNGRLTSTTR
jgi:hypothetical protein